jgi:hypothetical protein
VTRLDRVRHEFVDAVPDLLDYGVVYVSIRYAIAVHRCCCGCGYETVTPLAPTEWSLTFDGVSISLSPSVGNWSFPCQSHYWIRRNHVRWARRWSRDQVDAGRQQEVLRTKRGPTMREVSGRPAGRTQWRRRIRFAHWPWRK